MDSEEEVIHAGPLLRKKGGRVNNSWAERYFVLKGHTLYHYLKGGDTVSYLRVTVKLNPLD